MNHFPTRLAERAEGKQVTGCHPPRLFGELAPGRDLEILTLVDLTLGDRPGGVVPSRPERAAGVDEKHLEHPVVLAIRKQAGADLPGHVRIYRGWTYSWRQQSSHGPGENGRTYGL